MTDTPAKPPGRDSMPGMADHAKPRTRDRLIAALLLIVACGLLEVWASWLSIGAVSGFPKLGRMTTGWILPVTMEAYWTAALYAWLVDAAGPRSRKFAMWTAIFMFALSLTGQEAGHLIAAAHGPAPVFVVAFVTALPLISVGLGAILIHLRQADREEAAAETVRREAEAAAVLERRASRTESQNQNRPRPAAPPAVARTAERKAAASSQNQAAAVPGTSAELVPGTGGGASPEPAAELATAQNREPAGGEEDGRKLTMDELAALARGAVVDFADANDGKRISWQALGLELGVAKAKAGEVLKLIDKQDAAAAGSGGR